MQTHARQSEGRLGIPRGFDSSPVPWLGNSRKFDKTCDPEGGDVWQGRARAWNLHCVALSPPPWTLPRRPWDWSGVSYCLLFCQLWVVKCCWAWMSQKNLEKSSLIFGEMHLFQAWDVRRQKRKAVDREWDMQKLASSALCWLLWQYQWHWLQVPPLCCRGFHEVEVTRLLPEKGYLTSAFGPWAENLTRK